MEKGQNPLVLYGRCSSLFFTSQISHTYYKSRDYLRSLKLMPCGFGDSRHGKHDRKGSKRVNVKNDRRSDGSDFVPNFPKHPFNLA